MDGLFKHGGLKRRPDIQSNRVDSSGYGSQGRVNFPSQNFLFCHGHGDRIMPALLKRSHALIRVAVRFRTGSHDGYILHTALSSALKREVGYTSLVFRYSPIRIAAGYKTSSST
jgi:hypothetical protein